MRVSQEPAEISQKTPVSRRLVSAEIDHLLAEFGVMLDQIASIVQAQQPTPTEVKAPEQLKQRDEQAPKQENSKPSAEYQQADSNTEQSPTERREMQQRSETGERTVAQNQQAHQSNEQRDVPSSQQNVIQPKTSDVARTQGAQSEQDSTPAEQLVEEHAPEAVEDVTAKPLAKPEAASRDAAKVAKPTEHATNTSQPEQSSAPTDESLTAQPTAAVDPMTEVTAAMKAQKADEADVVSTSTTVKGKDVVEAALKMTNAQILAQSLGASDVAQQLAASSSANSEAIKSAVSPAPSQSLIVGAAKELSAKEQAAPERRQAPRVIPARLLERVEQVIKEAVQSKDGKSITLRLEQQSLGNIKATVSLRDGALHARLIAETQQTAEMLSERIGELSQALRRLGLDVEKITVAAGLEGMSEFNMSEESGYRRASRESFEQFMPFDDAGSSHGSGRPQAESVTVEDHWVA